MLGTSASALVGLLFVVVTLHFGKIHERADENMRATLQLARKASGWFGVAVKPKRCLVHCFNYSIRPEYRL
jgi:Flp pilus assembly protein protease CpaA